MLNTLTGNRQPSGGCCDHKVLAFGNVMPMGRKNMS
jgi:hypothetical protein